MWIVMFLLPALALAVWLVFCGTELWWVALLVFAAVEGLLWLAYWLTTTTREFLSGYVVKVTHYKAWKEKVVTRTSHYVNGKMVERTKVTYRDHPDKWKWELNTGKCQPISEEEFRYLSRLWGNRKSYPTYHYNCVSGGGMVVSTWNGYEDSTFTVTYTHRYRNPLKGSESLFAYKKKYTDSEAAALGLFPYPDIDGNDQQVILCDESLPVPDDMERATYELQKLNAFEGSKRQIHVFVLLFDAGRGKETSYKQRDFWKGLNKNELVLCLGVEGGVVNWCNALSWSDSVEWLLTLEKHILSEGKLDLTRTVQWLRGNLDGWERKEFSDFKYLANN